jgi:DNA-binding CsgD family transcriptional regulator/N-acetylneuraminic acid mutarotase
MSDQYEDLIEQPTNAELSERELEILTLLATGLSNKEIASQLFLSVNTVKVHLRNIFAKLGVQSRTEATVIAMQRGYISVPNTAAPGVVSANGEPALEREPIETAAQSPAAQTPEAQTLVEPLPITPAIEIEPVLPVRRRLLWIGLALLAIGLAVIAAPRGSAQSSGQTQPFSDSANAGAATALQTGDSVWQQLVPMSLARGRLAAAALGSRIVAIGGESSNGITGLVEIWDAVQQTWSIGQNKPTPVANVGAAVLNDQIIVPGGYTAAGTPTASVEAYHVISDEWTSLAALPAPRFAYAMATHNGKVYVFGGWDGQGYTNSTFIYDPATNAWTRGAPLPIGRGFAGAAALSNAIYVVGGYADDHEFDRCDRYLPDKDRWEACAPMSVARGGLSLVPISGRLYAIGGGWTGYLTFNERYDPGTNSWSVSPSPFTGQWRGMGAAQVGNDIYALGGWNGQYLNVLEKYSPFPFSIFVPATTK